MKLKIPTKVKTPSAALRILDKGELLFYRSTRLGTLSNDGKSFETDIPDTMKNLEYELKDVAARKVIDTGAVKNVMIESKKVEQKGEANAAQE